ncbi:penicillinase repressor BlaI [Salicibibacter cibarius]|uniref:Penicillinase repressor BlaI n=1 Tax=Salicibibacter cibarius TaxID=2743000 RepID=A0A7T7CBY0_9BACI|nr:penicillinase repressor BlaI [Salicibibacter cibarius]QQK76294.1 penicillinase repressor BlaI [Salicibibacter cibarius]
MTREVPSISQAEWEVMKVLWGKSPQTANAVISSMREQTEWSPKTIRTLLDRLTQKEVIDVNKEKKVYTFSPLYSEDECQRAEAQSLIKKIRGGTMKSALIQFIEDDSFSEKEIEELRSILDKKNK